MQKLFRSTRHNTFAGVCSGLALSRGWSISLVRVMFLLLCSFAGFGLLLYLAYWLAVPKSDSIGVTEPVDLPNDPLRRSRINRRIAGVCGGVAELVDVDPSLIRILYVLVVLFTGVGAVSYIYAWIIVPDQPEI